MCHKAYALDYQSFAAELAPILFQALETGCLDELTALIDTQVRNLRLPWDGAQCRFHLHGSGCP
jgi:hypothetical protein